MPAAAILAPLFVAAAGSRIYQRFAGRGLKKRQRALERRAAEARVAALERGKAGFLEESQQRGAALSQSLHARGLGDSSIRTEQTGAFERARARGLANIEDQLQLAREGRSLVAKQHKFQRRIGYINVFDDILGVGMGLAGLGAFDSGSSQPTLGGQPYSFSIE